MIFIQVDQFCRTK